MADLTASVGYGGTNNFDDVLVVQLLLDNHIAFDPNLTKRGIGVSSPDLDSHELDFGSGDGFPDLPQIRQSSRQK
jgi:hypothetical protein